MLITALYVRKNVYLVTTVEQLKDRVAQKQCVAIDFGGTVTTARVAASVRKFSGFRGKIAY